MFLGPAALLDLFFVGQELDETPDALITVSTIFVALAIPVMGFKQLRRSAGEQVGRAVGAQVGVAEAQMRRAAEGIMGRCSLRRSVS
jgi:hypothetical protein